MIMLHLQGRALILGALIDSRGDYHSMDCSLVKELGALGQTISPHLQV